MEGFTQSMDIGLLYEVYSKHLNPQRYEPKDLDVELRNLETEGCVIYQGDLTLLQITDKGISVISDVMDELYSDVPI